MGRWQRRIITMRELLIFQERDGLWEAGGSGSARVCVCVCMRERECVPTHSIKDNFFQRGEKEQRGEMAGWRGCGGKKQLAPARLCSYLIGMNNKCGLCAAVRRLKRGKVMRADLRRAVSELTSLIEPLGRNKRWWERCGSKKREGEPRRRRGAELIRTPGIGLESGMTMKPSLGPLAHNK